VEILKETRQPLLHLKVYEPREPTHHVTTFHTRIPTGIIVGPRTPSSGGRGTIFLPHSVGSSAGGSLKLR
jgi:hypothetical protein